MKHIINEFKEFIMRGNVLDLAVGVIIGGAFQKIIASLVNDVIMPVITLCTGGIDFTNWFIALDGNHYNTLQDAVAAKAATLNYGTFLTEVINFIIMAFIIFMMVKMMNSLSRKVRSRRIWKMLQQLQRCVRIAKARFLLRQFAVRIVHLRWIQTRIIKQHPLKSDNPY